MKFSRLTISAFKNTNNFCLQEKKDELQKAGLKNIKEVG
jgi:hypothetical protein